MEHYAVSGVTVATAATADHVICSLWNVSSARPLWLQELHVFKTTAGAADIPKIRRHTTKGTVGSTITPTIVNNLARDIAPVSTCEFNLAAFSAQPTFEALDLYSAVLPAVIGSGMMWQFRDPIRIPGGAGVAICTGSALAFPVSRVTAVWSE